MRTMWARKGRCGNAELSRYAIDQYIHEPAEQRTKCENYQQDYRVNDSRTPSKEFLVSGANEGIRTPGLLITNQLLYQLSYVGVSPSQNKQMEVYQKSVSRVRR